MNGAVGQGQATLGSKWESGRWLHSLGGTQVAELYARAE